MLNNKFMLIYRLIKAIVQVHHTDFLCNPDYFFTLFIEKTTNLIFSCKHLGGILEIHKKTSLKNERGSILFTDHTKPYYSESVCYVLGANNLLNKNSHNS